MALGRTLGWRRVPLGPLCAYKPSQTIVYVRGLLSPALYYEVARFSAGIKALYAHLDTNFASAGPMKGQALNKK